MGERNYLTRVHDNDIDNDDDDQSDGYIRMAPFPLFLFLSSDCAHRHNAFDGHECISCTLQPILAFQKNHKRNFFHISFIFLISFNVNKRAPK